MTEEQPHRVWVGDQVYDPRVDREGIVTDVKGETFYLRPIYMWTGTWTALGSELTVTLTREERLKQREAER
ncbi:hypothetical protein [Streptomyces sp. NPDC048419]|uniref:hypothetical protein n=1 Tax=Streptomyces sp. NPDC048419 TaxID=3365547 RepID=UPI003719FDA8